VVPFRTNLSGDARINALARQSPNFSSREAFNEVLALHRKRASAEDVQFLYHLCFPLEDTADPKGMRFVLWQPVALFLQYGFQVEIEEEMCQGQVVLAYLRHDAAAFTRQIIPEIEPVRSMQPITMVSSGPQVLLHVLTELCDDPSRRPDSGEKIQRMLMGYKSAVRRGDYSGRSASRAQLSELVAESAETDVRACIEFLLAGGEEARNWPPHSAALASERVLAREWLTPEEDAAWSHL
jgi:hypothetical protein